MSSTKEKAITLAKNAAKKVGTALLTTHAKTYGKNSVKKNGMSPDFPLSGFDCKKADPNGHFTVGFGKAEMLPEDLHKKRYYMAGYGPYKPINGILDAPFAHAAYIDDNSGRGAILLISLDCVGTLQKDVDYIRQQLAGFVRMTGCRSIDICSTHNHAGIDTMGMWGPLPKSGKDKEYMKIVIAAIKKSCELAYASRRDGDLYFGQVEVEDMQRDPRYPQTYSKLLTRFRFVPNDGSREIYLINFAGHAEMLRPKNKLVSADWPCVFREYIREHTGAETLLFQGAIGGMISMQIQDENPLKSIRIIGEKMGAFALAVQNERKLEPAINTLRRRIYLPCSNLLFIAFGRLRVFDTDIFSRPDEFYNISLMSELNYMEIGDVKCLLVPGEIFPELHTGEYLSAEESGTGTGAEANPLPLTEIAQDKDLLVFGLANAELGYIVPPNDYLLDPIAPFMVPLPKDRTGRKHYEETNSVGIRCAGVIAETFTEMMQTVNAAKR